MKLFKKLASIYSGSGFEQDITTYIKRWIRSSVSGAKIKMDNHGNMYVTKGKADTYPCVVAHLDQVQDAYPEDYKVVETAEIIFGYSPSNRSYCGLGADDKCGIWIALKMLKKHDAIKVAFFPGEEIGCIGSSAADMTFFNDVKFVIEPDRRGAFDLITSISRGDICSDEFIAATNFQAFGYKPTYGMMTDVLALKENGLPVSCINLSCGYYNPHTEEEYVIKADMRNALDFVDNIIENCKDVYPHKYRPAYDYYRSFSMYKGKGKGKEKNTSLNVAPQSLSANTQSGHSDEAAEYENEYEQYYEQYTEAEDWISANIWYNPDMTAKEFMASYGQDFDLLTEAEIEELFSYYRFDGNYADEEDDPFDGYAEERLQKHTNEKNQK